MTEPEEIKHLELKRKSNKKIKKSFNLLDFVVVKQKNKKTHEIKKVKVTKAIQRRGKIRKKKVTTIKKRIIRERIAKQSIATAKSQETVLNEETEEVTESLAKVELGDSTIEVTEEETTSLCQAIENVSIATDEYEESSTPVAPLASVQHSRNFRQYCNHFITQEIKQLTESVLKDLFKFQENKFQLNPIKAKANKRYVVGFKEVKKFLVVKRLKLVIIAPDLENNAEVENLVDEIKSLADLNKIPYVFSIKRRHIGYLLLKKVPVSLVGIFDYQGTNENVNELLKFVHQEKINYSNKTAKLS